MKLRLLETRVDLFSRFVVPVQQNELLVRSASNAERQVAPENQVSAKKNNWRRQVKSQSGSPSKTVGSEEALRIGPRKENGGNIVQPITLVSLRDDEFSGHSSSFRKKARFIDNSR